MTKQTIEIDVPEGYELVQVNNQYHDIDPITSEEKLKRLLAIKKKEPEYLEVREYLHSGSNGYVLHNSIQKNLHQKASDIESLPGFIRWVDDDWRKIYI